MDYNIIVPIYEGPMDLLLDLIKKNEIDIYDIPIFQITEQFMDYLNQASEINLELTADFILMASTLLEIKSKLLIPKVVFEEDDLVVEEEDPRKELVQKLLEYEKYKNVSELLRESEEYEKRAYYKLREELPNLEDIELLKDCDVGALSRAFLNILSRNKSKEVTNIYRDTFSISDGMNNIRNQLLLKNKIFFTELLSEGEEKSVVVTYFLSMLELIRIGFIEARQEEHYEDILILQKLVSEYEQGTVEISN